jgi:hypothetical protein
MISAVLSGRNRENTPFIFQYVPLKPMIVRLLILLLLYKSRLYKTFIGQFSNTLSIA